MTRLATPAPAIPQAGAPRGDDSPWPLKDVLAKLADAADHLLGDHSCDRHGYEEVGRARDTAREYVAALADLASRPPVPVGERTAAEERAAIVAWVREEFRYDGPLPGEDVADGIEQGRHWSKEPRR